jgi:hypothetical protein
LIDAEPLPTIILKVPRAAETTRRILTEDIAEGVGLLPVRADPRSMG